MAWHGPQVWDLRHTSHPVVRHPAHNALVLALQDHPELPGVLATGGRDTLVKVCVSVSGCQSEGVNE